MSLQYVLYRNYRYAKVSMGETANPTNPHLGLGPSTQSTWKLKQ
jgi:hypothetical protein